MSEENSAHEPPPPTLCNYLKQHSAFPNHGLSRSDNMFCVHIKLTSLRSPRAASFLSDTRVVFIVWLAVPQLSFPFAH